MANFLRKLFGKQGRLERLARKGDRGRFLQRLGEAEIFVFAALESDGLDPDSMTPEQLGAEVERTARDLSEREGFHPFVDERGGQRRLPFFTGEDQALVFAGEHSKEHNRVYPFQLLGVKGVMLAQLLPACDLLVMNDRTPDEHVFTDADTAEIQHRWG